MRALSEFVFSILGERSKAFSHVDLEKLLTSGGLQRVRNRIEVKPGVSKARDRNRHAVKAKKTAGREKQLIAHDLRDSS